MHFTVTLYQQSPDVLALLFSAVDRAAVKCSQQALFSCLGAPQHLLDNVYVPALLKLACTLMM